MWLIGLIILAVGILVHSSILFWLGVIVLLAGVVMYFVPARHESRRWYW